MAVASVSLSRVSPPLGSIPSHSSQSSSTSSIHSVDTTCCSGWSSTRIRTMDRTHFGAFQEALHRQRMEIEQSNSVQDSQFPYSQEDSQFFPSQRGRSNSNEDFERLMVGPPPGLRLFNAQAPAYHRSAFSCPAVGSPMLASGTPLSTVASNDATVVPTLPATPPEGKVKGRKAQAPKKQAAKKPKTKPVVISDDENEEEEGTGPTRWTDPEVIQLIAFRSEMDAEFERNAKKQGVHMWDKLQGQMVVACENFTKSEDACRKKWKVLYKQYCCDKRLLNISGEGRKVTCKFFDEIDAGFNNTANVKKFAHGDSRGSENPCPFNLNEDSPSDGPANEGTLPSEKTPISQKGPKKSQGETMIGYMGDMVCQTTSIAAEIKATTTVLQSITHQFERLVDKL